MPQPLNELSSASNVVPRVLVLALDDVSSSPRPRRLLKLLSARGMSIDLWALAPGEGTAVSRFTKLRAGSGTGPLRFFRRSVAAFLFLLKRACPLGPVFELLSAVRLGLLGPVLRLNIEDYDLVCVESLALLPIAFYRNRSVPVLFDAREHFPTQRADSAFFRLIERPVVVRLCRFYYPKLARGFTVSRGLQALYRMDPGVEMEVLHSAPHYVDIQPNPTGAPIRMVHHGVANANRRLHYLIEAAIALGEGYTLDMFLTGDPAEIQRLVKIAANASNVFLRPPVPSEDLVRTVSSYDLGLVFWPPTTKNLLHSAPNKFFEYIQARLAVAVGPLPSLQPIVEEYRCGVIANEFNVPALVDSIRELTTEDINAMKLGAARAAKVFCYERESLNLERAIDGALGRSSSSHSLLSDGPGT